MKRTFLISLLACCALFCATGVLVQSGDELEFSEEETAERKTGILGRFGSPFISIGERIGERFLEKTELGRLALSGKRLAMLIKDMVKLSAKYGPAFFKLGTGLLEKFATVRFNDRFIELTIPVEIDEMGNVIKSIGVEWDLGFSDECNSETGFRTVYATFIYTEPITTSELKFAGKKELPMNAFVLANAFHKIAKKFGGKIGPIAGPFVKLMEVIRAPTRLLPEDIFRIKYMLGLFYSAQDPADPITFSDVLPKFIMGLRCLNKSINTAATLKKHRLKSIPKKWDPKKIVRFEDTGIAESVLDIKLLPELFKSLGDFLRAIKVPASEWELIRLQTRRKQTEPTEAEVAYSNMRRIPSASERTAYFNVAISPLVDNGLDIVDRETVVKAIRVHYSRRFDGLMTVLALVSGGAIEGVIGQEAAGEDLAISRAVIEDRFLGLVKMVEGALAVMKRKGYEANYINLVADILAKLKAEEEQLFGPNGLFTELGIEARLPEGKSPDDYKDRLVELFSEEVVGVDSGYSLIGKVAAEFEGIAPVEEEVGVVEEVEDEEELL